MPTTAAGRTIRNPVIGDVVTFLETAAPDGRTVLDIELAARSGNAPHIHRVFDERFQALEGQLEVRLGRASMHLEPGQTLTAPAGVVHCFANPSDAPIRFRVELTPGHAGFEQALQIAYGLAEDGLVRKGGVPKSLAHTALLVSISGTEPAGPVAVLKPLLGRIAARARARGVEEELIKRYCA